MKNLKLSQSPLFYCGFRPFFTLTCFSALLFIGLWLSYSLGWTSLWKITGGWLVWHAHELIFGFASAAIAGFVLTAIPEFTQTPALSPRLSLCLSGVWLGARLAYLSSGLLSLYPALVLNLVFWLILLRYITPPIWQFSRKKQLSFPLSLLAIALLQVVFFSQLLMNKNALIWLYSCVHLLMILIIVATSRISMSVMNNKVENKDDTTTDLVYIARPPLRYLAITSIIICAIAELIFATSAITGWLSLAAMAAVFNLLNDWHIGKALFSRFALMLYSSYWLMALGYGLLGLAYLKAPILPSAGRHLLTVGAMTVSIFTVLNIVSRIHSGLWLDRRIWLPCALLLLIAAAISRALAGFVSYLAYFQTWILLAGILWLAVFSLYALYVLPILWREREDALCGCEEPRHH